MKAIILVAGMGTRLKPFTDTMPKCLTRVHQKTILSNALNILEEIGIEETIVVIGYLGEKIIDEFGYSIGNMKISFVRNNIYDKTNTSYSLWVGLKHYDNSSEEVLILEGDVFFEKQLIELLLKDNSEASTVVERYNPLLDGSFVQLSKDNIVTDWIHKSTRTRDFTLDDKYKTVNIHKFSSRFLKENFLLILERHIKEEKGIEPMEYIFQDMVKNLNIRIRAVDAKPFKWFEIDNHEELEIAEKLFG
jgi:choline kinase